MRQLAILVPYRNRQRYLDIFLGEVPRYLERANGMRRIVHGHEDVQEHPESLNSREAAGPSEASGHCRGAAE